MVTLRDCIDTNMTGGGMAEHGCPLCAHVHGETYPGICEKCVEKYYRMYPDEERIPDGGYPIYFQWVGSRWILGYMMKGVKQ